MNLLKKGALLALVLVTLFACSNDATENLPAVEKGAGDTYATISLQMAKATTRAKMDETWGGRDAIETIDVFLVNTATNHVDHESFTKDAFNQVNDKGLITPNKAIKATAGEKIKAYVVVNGAHVASRLKAVNASEFASKFTEEVKEETTALAKSSNKKDVVLMTNDVKPEDITIEKNVSEIKAISGLSNRIDVKVQRVVARALVTASSSLEKTIEIKNAQGEKVNSVTITKMEYAVGQGNTALYLLQHEDLKTPFYNYLPQRDKSENYTGIVGEFTKLGSIAESSASNVKKALMEEEYAHFALPVTHAKENYRKGNTTYIEVRATFTPENSTLADGVVYKEGEDIFFGLEDQKFYSTREAAESMGQGEGKILQKTIGYKKGVMKYIIWLNPEKEDAKVVSSPTHRNQVYHAHITGFNEMGLPTNPLDPEEVVDPKDPTSPIDPTDKLEAENTYLSVAIEVIDWGLNSYDLQLGKLLSLS